MSKRIRNKQIIFWVSPEEESIIHERMVQVGIVSLSAYLRKMAIEGMIINLQIPELKEVISLLRRCSNNLNQIARQVNSTGHLYDAELAQLIRFQEESWQAMNGILAHLAKLK